VALVRGPVDDGNELVRRKILERAVEHDRRAVGDRARELAWRDRYDGGRIRRDVQHLVDLPCDGRRGKYAVCGVRSGGRLAQELVEVAVELHDARAELGRGCGDRGERDRLCGGRRIEVPGEVDQREQVAPEVGPLGVALGQR